ncbi:DNA (cytosine-5-)-methyltransferase [Mycoplasma seminis]|uniref:Cytosine-specific methyltransferase n=1 Tax=Mycoplasma seminis TaxID=512749 RepID=A0ABY9HAG2_9MOLU|nr:DNA (cytosine-5-)-methyltransferase [Mycoplasma seminis]WLP85184.1 DNA (cytosine-5-)-methyltransferase [Mycoplasma seminis]
MQGGKRENSGRKLLPENEKKKGITIYLSQDDYQNIESSIIGNSFSSKCNWILHYGIEKYLQEQKSEIKFIDLFAGLGGIRIGFEQGFKTLGLKTKCVFSSEIKKHAIAAYKHNFNDEKIFGDITKISTSEIPDFDFLLAGFPCQPFSSAGNRLGFNDTRGTLFFDIERILKDKQPYGFILENVEGLVTHDGGNTLAVIINSLNDLGYITNYEVIDSAKFGLAQSRKRIYIVGVKKGSIDLHQNFIYSTASFQDIQENIQLESKSDFVTKLLQNYSPKELFGKSIRDKRGGSDNIHSWDIDAKGKTTAKQKELLNTLLKERRKKKWAEEIGIPWMDGMPLTLKQIQTFYNDDNLQEMLDDLVDKKYLVLEHPKTLVDNKRVYDESKPMGYNIVTGKLSYEFSRVLDPSGITPTLVATDIEKIGVYDNDNIRKLTIREGLRLFGFPETYSLEFLKYREAFDLLGNTVCVPVIKQIAQKLAANYKQHNKEIKNK